jgi:hypothetical protein
MAGILDNKERVLDFVLTRNGKQQLPFGELKFRYATYTDLHTFYEGTDGIADDASDRVMLEAYTRNQDQIVPEALDDGRLLNFQSGDLKLFDTSVLSGTSVLVDAQLDTQFGAYLTGSVNNFSDNRVLGEVDEFGTGRIFGVDIASRQFRGYDGAASIESLPVIFEDDRFQSYVNYQYLSPVYEGGREVFSGLPDPRRADGVGRSPSETSKDQVETARRVASFAQDDPEQVMLEFDSQSPSPDFMLQVFERKTNNPGSIAKLVAVSLGGVRLVDGTLAQLYQVGKIVTDETGADRFVALFTMRFQDSDSNTTSALVPATRSLGVSDAVAEVLRGGVAIDFGGRLP